jgi:hypothetical protein
MATIDASIYQNMRGINLAGAVDGYLQGKEHSAKMSELGKKQERDAYEFDQKKIADGEAQKQRKIQQAQLEASEYGRIFGGVQDQAGWDSGLKEWQKLGYSGTDQMPAQFDPKFNSSVIARSMPLAEQYARQDKQKEFGYKDQELGLKKQEIAAKRDENNLNKLGKVGELATKLRQERNGLPVTKATQDVSAAYNKMQSAAANSSPAGDMSLIYGFMRMQDPGSTVREGEFATAQNAAGIPDQVRNAYNRALSGERLSDVQRSDFLGQAKGIYGSQMDLQRQVDGTYGQLAKDSGIDPTKVLVNFEANKGGAQMVQMQAPDGSIRSIPESQVQAAIAAGGKPLGGVAQNGR